ncbi:MAG: hypothetical protein R3250_01390 [Melioribacteraceae bacterium]|nr:hypothetical protein [Melioribacteraceae bacterium]
MSKIIIGIHGLGNKPPEDLLREWWLKSICEGLKKINRYCFEPNFEIVYWADILNDKPLNNLISDPENPYYLDEPYTPSTDSLENKPHTTRQKFLDFLEEQMDKIFLNEDNSSNFNFIYDLIFKKYFKELVIYYSQDESSNDDSDKSAKESIRNRLVEVIKKHKGKEIFIIAHSMGSIIAYDVCSLLVKDLTIDTLVTMGSPLGVPIIFGKIAEELKSLNPETDHPRVPENVKRGWFNFSDIEDIVAMNYNLGDDYGPNSSGLEIKDFVVSNNYMINNERNPHKSYGYLRTPEFSLILADFLEKDIGPLKMWYLKISCELKQLFKRISVFIKRR